MKTRNESKLRVENKLNYTLEVFILSLAFTFLSAASGNSQETNAANGWNFGGDLTNYKTGLDNQISQHGQNSATLETIVENPVDFCALMQTMVAKDLSGKRIKMTGFIKSQGTNVKGSMWIRVDDIGNKIFADFDNMMDRPVAGDNDWTKCEIVFDVPEKCVIFYGFILTGVGKIWVDNVSFEIVDDTINKTAKSLDQPFPDEYMNQIKKSAEPLPEKPPVNLDFEEVKSE
jgi:hypothetical protein